MKTDDIRKIDAQWFAAGGEEEGLEVLYVQDGDPIEEPAVEAEPPKPEGKVLSESEYQELLKRADTSAGLAEPLSKLVEKMASPAPQQQEQRVGETDEEFYARMEQEAFLPGKFGEVMKKVAERQNAPVIGQMAKIILDQSKKIMRSDPERGAMFRKYEQEIVEVAGTLPQTADVYEQAYEKVLLRKQPEILEEQRKLDREALKKEILEELGIDPVTLKPGSKPMVTLGQGSAGGGGSAPVAKIRLYESERDRMIDLGLDPKDPDVVASYLRTHPRRK